MQSRSCDWDNKWRIEVKCNLKIQKGLFRLNNIFNFPGSLCMSVCESGHLIVETYGSIAEMASDWVWPVLYCARALPYQVIIDQVLIPHLQTYVIPFSCTGKVKLSSPHWVMGIPLEVCHAPKGVATPHLNVWIWWGGRIPLKIPATESPDTEPRMHRCQVTRSQGTEQQQEPGTEDTGSHGQAVDWETEIQWCQWTEAKVSAVL